MNENTFKSWVESERLSVIILANLKTHRAEIESLVDRFDRDEADSYYRFYHYSFKIFQRQEYIRNAVELFGKLAPEGKSLNPWYMTIVHDALSKTFEMHRTNHNWLIETRPILEARAHTHAFLRALQWSSANLDESPRMLPGEWALVLYLFGCR